MTGPELKVGALVDVTIKGVRLVGTDVDGCEHGCVTIAAEAHDGGPASWPMPPQAAIVRARADGLEGEPSSAEQSDRIAVALAVLDGMEHEGYIQPYVAAAVRKKVGLPPRHWPPQPGDVWTDENPFCDAWFAQLSNDDGRTDIVMAPVEGGPQGIAARTPEELLASSCELSLAYRKAGDQ